jgi:hypothetical protein
MTWRPLRGVPAAERPHQRLATLGGPRRLVLSRVSCIAWFGDTIRVSSVLGFKLQMKLGLFRVRANTFLVHAPVRPWWPS